MLQRWNNVYAYPEHYLFAIFTRNTPPTFYILIAFETSASRELDSAESPMRNVNKENASLDRVGLLRIKSGNYLKARYSHSAKEEDDVEEEEEEEEEEEKEKRRKKNKKRVEEENGARKEGDSASGKKNKYNLFFRPSLLNVK
ncbi:hypothetical protein KPH14_005519 [Odynerus spinipes]|uniref:Uncharacterized protein n=1 Tax=Odynerus spinipes TaxID=1348599 RepID=A0AAD9RC44_9HYME|nr:hypothetical protein KPH14_005519 [Odynerus spinipes]